MTYTIKGEARAIPMTPGEAALLDGAIAWLSERVSPEGEVVDWNFPNDFDASSIPDFVRQVFDDVDDDPGELSGWLAHFMEMRRCAEIAPPE